MKLENYADRHKLTIPTQGSKLYKVLEGLYAGYRLTVLTAYRSCGTTELRKHVTSLKDYGWDIQSEWVTGKGDPHKEYWIGRA